MNRVLLFGADGQIGWRLARLLGASHNVKSYNRSQVDLADVAAVWGAIRKEKPDVIINAAAYTAVDQAEKEPALARAVNAVAPGAMAEEAARLGCLLIHFSTDYVFDGTKTGPYLEDDEPAPLNTYGRTKLEGEELVRAAGGQHLIFRTSWVYDSRGRNFLLAMLRLARERDELRIVNDQRGVPNWAHGIAQTVVAVLERLRGPDQAHSKGVYNLSATGQATWFEFARAIFAHPSVKRVVKPPRLTAIRSDEYPTPARRPANSMLATEKLANTFAITSASWTEGLDQCLHEAGALQ